MKAAANDSNKTEIDPFLRSILEENGYEEIRVLPTGEIAGLQRYLFTVGLVIGLDVLGWRTRWCYPTRSQALEALKNFSGTGHPSGPWIKQKPQELVNPMFSGLKIFRT